MTQETLKKVVSWLCDEANSHNCDECPYNKFYSEWPGNRLPCGQFRCWVDVHCEEEP